jgi:tryptophanyl-tRNA synthetase
MTDDADTIAGKVRKATTDPNPLPDSIAGLEGRPKPPTFSIFMPR